MLIKVQEWSKNVNKFTIACFEVNILRSRSPKGQQRPKTVTIYIYEHNTTLCGFFWVLNSMETIFYIRGQRDVLKVKVIWESF